VDSKYGSALGRWCSREPIGPYRVGLWKNIMRGWGKFCSHTSFDMGDGSKVRFWHDLCVGLRLLGSISCFIWYCSHNGCLCCDSCGIFWRCHSVEHELY
jgi:hypothetical protein